MTGQKKYVPSIVLDELNNMKKKYNLNQDSKAFEKIIGYSRVGREMERILNADLINHKNKKRGFF